MPDPLVRSALRRMGEGLEGIEALKEKCLTSMTATAITSARKTSFPAAIIVSTDGRIDYAFLSDAMKEFDGMSWPRKGTPLPYPLGPSQPPSLRRHPMSWQGSAPAVRLTSGHGWVAGMPLMRRKRSSASVPTGRSSRF